MKTVVPTDKIIINVMEEIEESIKVKIKINLIEKSNKIKPLTYVPMSVATTENKRRVLTNSNCKLLDNGMHIWFEL